MAVFDDKTQRLMEYRHLINHPNPETRQQWQQSGANEFGRLAQGLADGRAEAKGTDTIDFIFPNEVPTGQKVTYARICCNI